MIESGSDTEATTDVVAESGGAGLKRSVHEAVGATA